MDLFHVEPEMASLLQELGGGDMPNFAELHEDPSSDAQIELYVYTCFLTCMRTGSVEHLDKALQRAEGWVVVANDHPNYARRREIFDRILHWKWQLEALESRGKRLV
jgi:hypothetical protein